MTTNMSNLLQNKVIIALITSGFIIFLISLIHTDLKIKKLKSQRPALQKKIWDYTFLDTYKTAEEICGPWQVVKRDKGNNVFAFNDLSQIEDLLNSCKNELILSESEAVDYQLEIVEEIFEETY